QLDFGRDVEGLVDLEDQQVDLEEGEQLRGEGAVHVEDRQGREGDVAVLRFVEEVGDELLDAHAPVLVRVVQVEVDLGEQAAADAGPGHRQVQLGRRPQPRLEHQ